MDVELRTLPSPVPTQMISGLDWLMASIAAFLDQSKIENGVVKDIRHDGTGCSICCSSASVMSETLIGKKEKDAKKIAETYINMLTNKEYDESVDLEEAIVYQGVRKFPARIKCASIAWKAFEGTTEESE